MSIAHSLTRKHIHLYLAQNGWVGPILLVSSCSIYIYNNNICLLESIDNQIGRPIRDLYYYLHLLLFVFKRKSYINKLVCVRVLASFSFYIYARTKLRASSHNKQADYPINKMTGRRKPESSSSKPKLPDVPPVVTDVRASKRYRKGEFLGKVSLRSSCFCSPRRAVLPATY